MKEFSIDYHREHINIEFIGIEGLEKYRLSYDDGRWLVMDKRPDDTKTVATYNDNISYSTASVWAIESKSQGPDWINREQLQVIGEIISNKQKDINHSAAQVSRA